MKSATDSVVNSAIQTLDALEQSIPTECKTKAINSQFIAERVNIESIKTTCEIEKQAIEQVKIKWQIAFFSMIAIIVIWFVRKIAL